MEAKSRYKNYAVLGLGRFGISIVETLALFDVDILACDRDELRLHKATQYATHVVQADLTDESSLRSLGLGNFDVVVICMGTEFETSLVATMIAKEAGAGRVVVKAMNRRQKKILQSVGADEVVLPEHEMGVKLARRLAGISINDVLGDSEFFTVFELRPMEEWVGKTIRQADIRRKHEMTILAIRRDGKLKLSISPDMVLEKDDILVALSEKVPEHRK